MERIAKSLGRAWPCVLSALLLLLAFPPLGWWPLVFVALVPWLRSLDGLDGRAAWRSGYAFGFTYGLGQLLWLGQFVSQWVGGWLLGAMPWLLACVLYALYFGWTAVLVQRVEARKWPWAVGLVWAGIETIRSYLPVFAFPWGLLATPLAFAPPLAQLARFGTIFLVSALVVTVNAELAKAGKGFRPSRVLVVALAALAVSVGLSFLPESGSLRRFVAVQPGVDVAFGDPRTRDLAIARNVSTLLADQPLDAQTLVVLPEGMVDVPVMPPRPLFPLPEAPIVFGGRRREGEKEAYQTAFGYDGAWKHADKTRLVIFGEFVPGRDLFPFLAESFRLPSGDMSAGRNGVQAFDLASLRVGPVICFEALFPDIAYRQAMNGARVLPVMSIDDWYLGSAAPEQLRLASIWRAVETGLPVVRAASLGHTFAVDGRGRVAGEVPLRGARSLAVDLRVPEKPPTFPGLPAFPVAASLFALWVTARKKA